MWNIKKTLYYETINRITRKNYNPKTILAMIQTNANNKDAKVFIFNDRQEAEKATIENIQFQEQQKDQRFATQTLLVNLNVPSPSGVASMFILCSSPSMITGS